MSPVGQHSPSDEAIKLLPPLTVTGTGIDQGLAPHADGMQTVC
jgi:4-aminobutyrate aminotransferase-like enzyme